MYLLLKPTQKGGGVSITADEETMDLVERLLTNHAMNSYCCWEDGSCMALSRYFDKDRSHVVDWVTLIVGLTVLRTSIGYFASKQDHALVCCLEYQLQHALSQKLNLEPEVIDSELNRLKGFGDDIFGDIWYSRLVYLYKLKTSTNRKRELLAIIRSLDPMSQVLDKEYIKSFKDLTLADLDYPAGTKFSFDL